MRWISGVAAALMLACTAAHAAPRDPRLGRVHSWAFAIGDGNLSGDLISRFSSYDLVVVDGQGASARQVRALRRAGKLVLAYLDVGTLEPGRPWYASLGRFRLNYWSDWGEWYANVSARGFRSAIAGRIAPAILRKGFDGLFLDNTDMIESHPGQAGGMKRLVRALSALVHRRGGLLFTQNGEGSIAPTLRYYDGWNREDVTGTYDFGRRRYVLQQPADIAAAQRALRWIGARGLLVLATDYTAANTSPSTAITNACTAGALPFVSDIGLRRVPAVAARCP